MSNIVRPWRQARPYRPSWRDHVRDVASILGQALVIGALIVGLIVWTAIAAASQVSA